MRRGSSPCRYSRYSLNSAEVPRSLERCVPAIGLATARRACQCTPRTASSSAPYDGPVISGVDVAARRLDARQQIIDDAFSADALRLRGKVRQHAMAQHRQRDALHVVRRHDESSAEHRMGFRAEDERLSCAWAGAPTDIAVDELRGARIVGSRRAHQARGIPQHGVRRDYVAYELL